jgi:hypothetical protein
MECDIVEVIRALEPGKRWHRDEISARYIVGFTVTLADVGARRLQEGVSQFIARAGIANADGLSRLDAIGKVFALVDIENRVLPQHRDEAR